MNEDLYIKFCNIIINEISSTFVHVNFDKSLSKVTIFALSDRFDPETGEISSKTKISRNKLKELAKKIYNSLKNENSDLRLLKYKYFSKNPYHGVNISFRMKNSI